jgi:acetyltransferase-like isoleucine patch superfamily enzyme
MTDENQAYALPFASVGQDVTIWPRAHIVGAEHISIGDSVIIDDFVFLMASAPCQIGSFVHISSGAAITGGGEFVAEDFATLSGGTRVYTWNDDYLGGSLANSAIPAPYRAPAPSFVRMGRHAIVGANSVVLPGVAIGEGAAVGALSLVNRDLKPWTVYAGSPARPLRERPSKKILALEAQLRTECYDDHGRYIPVDKRGLRGG